MDHPKPNFPNGSQSASPCQGGVPDSSARAEARRIVPAPPTTARRHGATPSISAVLVALGEDEELAAVLRRLHSSPAERVALADRALRRVRERFAWPAVAQATVGQYLAAMEGPVAMTGSATRKGPAAC